MLFVFGPPLALIINVVALVLGQSKALAIPGLAISGLTSAVLFMPIIARLLCL
jgi:hypothetical protein